MKLMECVPNFSEGRDSSILNAIAAAIKSVKGVVLLYMVRALIQTELFLP